MGDSSWSTLLPVFLKGLSRVDADFAIPVRLIRLPQSFVRPWTSPGCGRSLGANDVADFGGSKRLSCIGSGEALMDRLEYTLSSVGAAEAARRCLLDEGLYTKASV
jgi:hypothetical protein